MQKNKTKKKKEGGVGMGGEGVELCGGLKFFLNGYKKYFRAIYNL